MATPNGDRRDKLPQNKIHDYIKIVFGEDVAAMRAYLAAIKGKGH